jgi:hypothetical protein
MSKTPEQLEAEIQGLYTHFDRIEEKVNYIINLLEVLIETDIDEPEQEEEDFLGGEGWIQDLDAWKDGYEDE